MVQSKNILIELRDRQSQMLNVHGGGMLRVLPDYFFLKPPVDAAATPAFLDVGGGLLAVRGLEPDGSSEQRAAGLLRASSCAGRWQVAGSVRHGNEVRRAAMERPTQPVASMRARCATGGATTSTMSTTIRSIHARRVWDSRGRPTVEAEVLLNDGRAIVRPALRKARAKVEPRDGTTRFGRTDVRRPHVDGEIARTLVGHAADEQASLDARHRQLWGAT